MKLKNDREKGINMYILYKLNFIDKRNKNIEMKNTSWINSNTFKYV